jgi:hypothetical protein
VVVLPSFSVLCVLMGVAENTQGRRKEATGHAVAVEKGKDTTNECEVRGCRSGAVAVCVVCVCLTVDDAVALILVV